ncbi:MAG: DUF4330 domain-containing protein [Candidatus Omnitrophica bacterium]|nr:DUF4330 domain-containing protein [Candidatus Omnitrophota bacterium]
MKVIDEKGRIFGLINIFDLFVLFVIAFIALFAFKWIRLADDPSWVKVENVHIRCEAVALVPVFVTDIMKEGDVMRGADGTIIARIEKILKVEPVEMTLKDSAAAGEAKAFIDPTSKRVTVLIEMLAYKRLDSLRMYAGAGVFNIGLGFSFETKNYNVTWTVIKVINKG